MRASVLVFSLVGVLRISMESSLAVRVVGSARGRGTAPTDAPRPWVLDIFA